MKLGSSRQVLEKYSQYHKNPISGSRIVPCRQTHRHVEAISRFS